VRSGAGSPWRHREYLQLMGTLVSELGPYAERLSPRPRIYADANVPAGVVAYMRHRLHWDVLFVLEEDTLRRAPDVKHYKLAQQLRRTLVTIDRDYLDDRRFPPDEGCGVVVLSAPDERGFTSLLDRVDRTLFRCVGAEPGSADEVRALPLVARKLHLHTDWPGEM
jgi:hypothetical protein